MPDELNQEEQAIQADTGMVKIGNTIHHTGHYSLEQLEKMIREVRSSLSRLEKLINRYKVALGDETDAPEADGFVSDVESDGGGFEGEGGGAAPAPSLTEEQEVIKRAALWAQHQQLDRMLDTLTEELNRLRERYQAKVDSGDIPDTVSDPGREKYFTAKTETAALFGDADDNTDYLPDFGDAPVKDAKVRKVTPKQMSLFSEKAEVSAALPDGVGLAASGYGKVYR